MRHERRTTGHVCEQKRVGERIRRLRTRRGWTLRLMAEETGFSQSFLSQLERGKTNGSVASLLKVADVLQVSVSEFFDDSANDTVATERNGHRPSLQFGVGCYKEILTTKSNLATDLFYVRFEPGGTTGSEQYSHGDADEIVFVCTGAIDVEIGDRVYRLDRLDSLSFWSGTPHRAVNLSDEPAEALWAVISNDTDDHR